MADLLAAAQAAARFGANYRRAERIAARAMQAGDPAVSHLPGPRGAYVAPVEWWQRALAAPAVMGRPKRPQSDGAPPGEPIL